MYNERVLWHGSTCCWITTVSKKLRVGFRDVMMRMTTVGIVVWLMDGLDRFHTYLSYDVLLAFLYPATVNMAIIENYAFLLFHFLIK